MHTFGKTSFALILFAGLSLAAYPAQAQNLVHDGSFEAADAGAPDGSEDIFSSSSPFDTTWTITQGTAAIDTNTDFIFDGSKSLYLNADALVPTILAQTLATTPGASYTLSFYADDDIDDSPLTVAFGGTTLEPISVPQNGYPNFGPGSNAGAFSFFSYSVTAQSNLTSLTFSAAPGAGGNLELDDISVTAPAAVPEASTVVSMGLMLGLGCLIVLFRKRRASGSV